MTYGTEPVAGGPPADAVPHCYRHPDRETYIRCQRCSRPICPDCQIPAAVGFQCPDDVKAGNRDMRQPRTTFGGVLRNSAGAPVTYTIMVICIAVAVLQEVLGRGVERTFAMIGGPAIDPSDPAQRLLGVSEGQFERLITAAFLHGGLVHLAVNMFSLFMLGPALERMLGRSRFAALYLLSALGGSAMSYLIGPPDVLSVGASGAIFGLFGALFVASRQRGYDLRPILGILAVNALIGFLYPRIDWRAHLGGLVVGALVMTAMAYAPKDRRTLVQVGGCVGVLALITVAVLVRTAQLSG